MSSRNSNSWMWAEALELLDQAERLQRQFCGLAAGSVEAQARWEPPVDIVETANELLIAIALPGVAAQRVELEFVHGGLEVRAHRAPPINGRTAVIRRLEIPYGRFERQIALPAGRYELVEQTCIDGCLQLRLRKR